MANRNSSIELMLAALLLAPASVAVAADVPAMTYESASWAYASGPGPGGGSAGGYTYGWSFTPTTNVTVTALAVADAFEPGFAFNHSMFLWDFNPRAVLRSAFAPAGAEPGGVMGANEFRYYAITPIELFAGTTYVVGVGFPATSSFSNPYDRYYSMGTSDVITFDPRITWVDGRISGALNSFPNVNYGTGAAGRQMLGPCNFLIAPPPPPPACAGDLNGDRVVNTSDLVTFLGRFGQTINPPGNGADFVADGVVNTADLVFFLGRFGSVCP